MADEQTIYLSPEEELTSVRERLERTQARRITLVIPQQTQLRSHVGWRLIHARMRELGKELLVISPDRQVRAVARAAGFNVAESQESPGSRPRPGGSVRPGNVNTRGAARSRIGSNRGGPESQPPPRRRLTPSASSRPVVRPSSPGRADYEEEITQQHSGRKDQVPEVNPQVAPAAFLEQPEENFGPAFDFHINTTPSVHPSVPHVEEEEDDLDKYYDDYNTAQNIRESARTGPDRPDVPPARQSSRESRMSGAGKWGVDHYAYMEDEQQRLLLPEQKGSVPGSLEEIGSGMPDISERFTEVMENDIEDLGDIGAIDLPQIRPRQVIDEPTGMLREQEERPRPRPRSGPMQPQARHSPRAPRPGMQDVDEDGELLALPERPTQGGMPLSRPSRGLAGAGARPSQSLKSGVAPQSSARVHAAPGGQRSPSRQLPPQPAATPRRPASSQRRPRRRGRGVTIVTILVLLLVAGFLVFYFVPTATVTISLQAQTYSQTVQLNATANPQAHLSDKLPAQMLAQNFSASGQGTATGTTRVGHAQAQGLVAFTNTGSKDIIVPSGTIVATQSGIQFVTGAEAEVSHVPPGNTFPAVPVSAQQIGEIGNVPAGSITVIPSASLAKLAEHNHVSATTIDLTVTNAQATSGGGATNVPAVRAQDLQALTQTLHQKLQNEVLAWQKAQVHSGDIAGALLPDVVNSAKPLPQEQLSGAPGVGQAATSGTFSGVLSLQVKLLVARAADIQAAVGAQLNAATLKLRPPSILARQLPVTLTDVQKKLSADGSTLAITAKATGEVIRQVSVQEISNSLVGKGINQVKNDLRGSLASAGILDVQVSVFPAFLGIMPLQAGRIQIVLAPIEAKPPQGVPNG